MAILFNGTSDYLSLAAALATAVPVTISGWGKPMSGGPGSTLATITGTNSTFIYVSSSDGAFGGMRAGVNAATALSTLPVTRGGWQHFAGVFASNTSRSAYTNASGAATDTANTTPTTLAKTLVGAYLDVIGNSPSVFWCGLLADVAFWNVALTVGELAALAAGARPWQIRPSALISCITGEKSVAHDLAGRLWTLNGAPKFVSEMPPAILAAAQRRSLFAPVSPPPPPPPPPISYLLFAQAAL